MIVLDTNVVSELMRPEPAPQVTACLRAHGATPLAVTTITVAEILYGIRRLTAGARRSGLEASFFDVMAQGFRGRLLVFDEAAADCFATILVERGRAGRPAPVLDAMIAAIARSRGATVATRHVADFVECGLDVLDPWAWRGAQA
jgi:hypothetical protein